MRFNLNQHTCVRCEKQVFACACVCACVCICACACAYTHIRASRCNRVFVCLCVCVCVCVCVCAQEDAVLHSFASLQVCVCICVCVCFPDVCVRECRSPFMPSHRETVCEILQARTHESRDVTSRHVTYQ